MREEGASLFFHYPVLKPGRHGDLASHAEWRAPFQYPRVVDQQKNETKTTMERGNQDTHTHTDTERQRESLERVSRESRESIESIERVSREYRESIERVSREREREYCANKEQGRG